MVEYVFLFIQIIVVCMFLFLTIALYTGAPFVPSKKKTVKKMIELAKIKRHDIVYDLGSGDGRILFPAARLTDNLVTGIEINPLLVLYTNVRILFSPQKNHVVCRVGNFWNTDLSNADCIFVYLLPWKMDKLAEKLKKEVKPGTRIISNSFIFPHWDMVDKDEEMKVYVFTV